MMAAPDWLIVGLAVKPHGVHGGLLAEIITDFPERMVAGLEVGFGTAEGGVERMIEVHEVRYHRGRWLLYLKGMRHRDEVDALRGQYLFLPEQALEDLPEGYYYEHHLVGLACRSLDGEPLGTITGLEEGPGQMRVVVRRDRREFLVPWVPQIVREVDLEGGSVTLDPPAGLLDDDFESA
jgi:16S rRNA processing protein RimM